MTLTAGRYVGNDMGVPINTMSYLRVEELFKITLTMRGEAGGEQFKFVVGTEEKTVALTKTDQEFTFKRPESGEFSVFFLNDNAQRNGRLKISAPADVYYQQFPAWRCGSAAEDVRRCQLVRDGFLNWNGEYKYTLRE